MAEKMIRKLSQATDLLAEVLAELIHRTSRPPAKIYVLKPEPPPEKKDGDGEVDEDH